MKWFSSDQNNSQNDNQNRVDINNNDTSRNWNVWAVEELKYDGGGFVHNENGKAFKYVAPIPKK